jgi:hypothetical protein
MEARSTPALPTLRLPTKKACAKFFDMTAFSWKSPEPTAVTAAVAIHAASRRWLSFFRRYGLAVDAGRLRCGGHRQGWWRAAMGGPLILLMPRRRQENPVR